MTSKISCPEFVDNMILDTLISTIAKPKNSSNRIALPMNKKSIVKTHLEKFRDFNVGKQNLGPQKPLNTKQRLTEGNNQKQAIIILGQFLFRLNQKRRTIMKKESRIIWDRTPRTKIIRKENENPTFVYRSTEFSRYRKVYILTTEKSNSLKP